MLFQPRSTRGVNPRSDPADDYHRQRLADGRACLAAALDYLARGWSVLPLCPPDHAGEGREHGRRCGQPGKVPVVLWKPYQENRPREADVRGWWRRNPTRNVGVALGPVSGLIRVDVDGPSGEARLLQLSGGDIPPTPEFTSGRDNGGRGLLYAIPPGITLRTTYDSHKKKEELRFQARGAQTVLPPSRHHTGSLYAWRPGHGPGEIKVALAPRWLVEQLGEEQASGGRKRARVLEDGETIRDGERDSTLTSMGGTMRRRGFSRESIEAALLFENGLRCEPPLPDDQVKKIAESLGRYKPVEAPDPPRCRHRHREREVSFTIDVEV